MAAHNRGQEALGIIRVVERSDPALVERVENVALLAAATVLAGRDEEAVTLLNDARLDGFAEASIWRGAALAHGGDFLAADSVFRPGDSLLSRYPHPLKARLAFLRIQTAFANRDIRTAEAWINRLQQERAQLSRGQQAELDYERARLAVGQTEFDLAEELFETVMASGDKKFAFRAENALISLGLRQGFIDENEAIERLERLRYAWRGDRSKLHLLRRLGELYQGNQAYFDTLDVYRAAVKYFPGDPVADDLTGEMTEVFRELFLEGKADEMAPLRAIALYEEFRELTPAGVEGDRLIENIADRLAAIDLLSEAAKKLEDEERLPPGQDRIRLSTKLALLYLMDDKPTLALEALQRGRAGIGLLKLDEEIETDRDRLLARARFQLGEYDKAIKEMAGDVSVEADLLRRDIFRTTLNWQESAKTLQRLAGNPPDDPALGVQGKIGRYVVNWAVALYQNNDRDGLRDLVDLWGPAMANSPLSGVFDYITNEENPPSGSDVLVTVDQLIGQERYRPIVNDSLRHRRRPPPRSRRLLLTATDAKRG